MMVESSFMLYRTKVIKKFHNAPEAGIPEFLVAKLRESTKLCHVRPSVWYNSAHTETVFMKIDV